MSPPASLPVSRRRNVLLLAGLAAVVAMFALLNASRFPPDTEPRGAYLRIAAALVDQKPEAIFAYLEEDAQVACYTILTYAKKASSTIRTRYSKEHRVEALPAYADLAQHKSPAALWVALAKKEGWLLRLRKDLSGVKKVQVVGERATVITARGTRYPFRRRPNKIWGLTLFTAHLDARAQKLARDWDLIQRAANDFKKSVP